MIAYHSWTIINILFDTFFVFLLDNLDVLCGAAKRLGIGLGLVVGLLLVGDLAQAGDFGGSGLAGVEAGGSVLGPSSSGLGRNNGSGERFGGTGLAGAWRRTY
ncbi:hypothetical protein TIFTF001_002207 [Ficus carica]|uniref:Uncharacterized protein n=1 Tax=Ficus carica TaxID=3494 RepID=A0AA87Z2V7_FICCA|nr:hypothetical protein TIFTF001_002207 [Ficus carica]